MTVSFSGGELVEIAIGIEMRGIAFYDVMARSTKNAIARDVFQFLADMERHHVQVFQEMLGEADKYRLPETYSGERIAYLKSLIDNAVFTDDLATSEMATRAGSDIEALELAIGAEKDSILFYYEMKDTVPKRVQPTLNKIIAEEKAHLRQLSEVRSKLAAI